MRNLRRREQGISLGGLIVGLALLVVLALLGLRLLPAYLEYSNARSAIQSIARERQASTPAEIRRAFEARAAIDDVQSVKASDLDITKDGGEVVISFAYRREVPLFANVGVYIDFAASSRGQ
ncbi:MAG TPA: DUF4845 domain-containing protein [Burkholderiales bacterium]|nr:DUF4845 domain-containing protein [Burkholderiales bacterium]